MNQRTLLSDTIRAGPSCLMTTFTSYCNGAVCVTDIYGSDDSL